MRRDPHERVGGALVGEDPARVVVEEEELVRERGEALLAAVPREVVRREVARREARRDADGRADVEAERSRLLVRRALLTRGIRQLVPAERGHVETEVAEHVEGLVEPLVGVALVRERADECSALVEDLRLEIVADAVDLRAVVLREVEILECRVQLDERRADPRIEGFDVRAHRRRASLTTATEGLGLRPGRAGPACTLAAALVLAVLGAAVAGGTSWVLATNSATYEDERGEDTLGSRHHEGTRVERRRGHNHVRVDVPTSPAR